MLVSGSLRSSSGFVAEYVNTLSWGVWNQKQLLQTFRHQISKTGVILFDNPNNALNHGQITQNSHRFALFDSSNNDPL